MHEAFIKSQYLNYIEGKKQQTMDTKFLIITSTTCCILQGRQILDYITTVSSQYGLIFTLYVSILLSVLEDNMEQSSSSFI